MPLGVNESSLAATALNTLRSDVWFGIKPTEQREKAVLARNKILDEALVKVREIKNPDQDQSRVIRNFVIKTILPYLPSHLSEGESYYNSEWEKFELPFGTGAEKIRAQYISYYLEAHLKGKTEKEIISNELARRKKFRSLLEICLGKQETDEKLVKKTVKLLEKFGWDPFLKFKALPPPPPPPSPPQSPRSPAIRAGETRVVASSASRAKKTRSMEGLPPRKRAKVFEFELARDEDQPLENEFVAEFLTKNYPEIVAKSKHGDVVLATNEPYQGVVDKTEGFRLHDQLEGYTLCKIFRVPTDFPFDYWQTDNEEVLFSPFLDTAGMTNVKISRASPDDDIPEVFGDSEGRYKITFEVKGKEGKEYTLYMNDDDENLEHLEEQIKHPADPDDDVKNIPIDAKEGYPTVAALFMG